MRKLPAEALGRWAAVLLCVWFAAAGLVLIPYPGIQNDEALFGGGLYPPIAIEGYISIFKHHLPTMLMTYIGAVKIWLYALVFWVWEPSVWSIRVPALLLGTLSVWLAWRLMRRTLGLRAALIGTALLATDATYLLTTTFDWGPVAIQHVLLVGGCLALVRYYEMARTRDLAIGFFLFGLGLWDKALFVWMLVGLGVAVMVVFPRDVIKRVSRRTVAVAAIAFAIGAFPLLKYNVSQKFVTFRGNTRYSTEEFVNKGRVLRASFQGASLFGYLAPGEPSEPPGKPQNALERASVKLDSATGNQWRSWTYAAALAALVLVPFAGRAGWFALVFSAVTWAQMAFNQNTGGGTHHAVLMWPFPQILMAAAFTGAARRLKRPGTVLLVVVTVFLCASNVLVLNHHLVGFVRGGTTTIWTDALYPLSERLGRDTGRNVYVLDWGMFDALRLLNQGKLRLLTGNDPLMDADTNQNDRADVAHMLADENAVFVAHTPEKFVFEGVWPRFEEAMAAAGYRKESVELIRDRSGRPVFQMFRVAKL
ncbi:MAG TPA: glycosyltransferase family 39 protein [Bryobacteraceae bacterium]|nr:glycosyltransferase family 39 protein [Bryobacteraceae bacterium]